MKTAALLVYIFLNFAYLCLGSGRLWGGIHHITQYLLIAALAWGSLNPKKQTKLERLLLYYVITYTALLSVFTAACIGAYKDWVLSYTTLFTTFTGMIFIVFLLYGWYKHKYELGEY